MDTTMTLMVAGAAALAAALPRAKRRLELSMAKHPSLAGHSRMAKRVAKMLPGYSYDEAKFFGSDGAPDDVVARRKTGLAKLSAIYSERFTKSVALTQQAAESISDLQFTGAYRVP